MQKYLIGIIVSLFFSLCCQAQKKNTNKTLYHPTDTNIQYTGRIDFSDSLHPAFTFPGVQIRTGFTGTSLDMMCKLHSGYFMAEIDGGEPFEISFHGNTITRLASDLPDGTHQAIVTFIGEGYENVPEFHGFFVDKGKKLAPATPLPERKIEFIGNSITCGYGVEASSEAEAYTAETANFYYSYAALTARSLNAQALVVARSGIGVYRNYDGPKNGNDVNMNTEYPYTLLYNHNIEWDFSQYTPDVVCINLGTNDLSTKNYDIKLYRNAYLKFIQRVRGLNPKAKIVLLTGSMLNGKELEEARKALDSVKSELNKNGDSEIYRFDMSPQTGDLGYGAD